MEKDIRFKYRKYYQKTEDKWICLICSKMYSTDGNTIKHIKKKHSSLILKDFSNESRENLETQYTYKTEHGKEKPVLRTTWKVIEWKVMHGISMEALCDSRYKEEMFKYPESIKCPETMRKIMHCIADQILETNINLLANEKVSLIADGGTVNKTKWYAIGSTKIIYDDSSDIALFDVVVSQGDTTDDIKNIIEEVQKKLATHNAIIAAICTDNAANIANGFINTHALRQAPTTSTQSMPLIILRVACAIHTFNLVIKDVAKNNPHFGRLCEVIKILPKRLQYLGEDKKESIGLTGCPNWQPQRWNHLLHLYIYANNRVETIRKIFPEINITKKDCELMLKILHPLGYAVTYLEGDKMNQAHVYEQYLKLHKEWEDLGREEGCKTISQALIERLDYHCKYTLDIGISRIAYYATDAGTKRWQDVYQPRNINLDSAEGDRIINRKRNDLKLKMKETIENLCSIWHIADISDKFIELIDKCKYDKNCKELCIKSRKTEWERLHAADEKGAEDIDNFYKYIAVLPASEAHSERTFARMRDLISENMSNLGDESLRDEIIIKMHVTRGNCYHESSKYYTSAAIATPISTAATSVASSEVPSEDEE